MSVLTSAAGALLSFLFPDACLSCGASLEQDEHHICDGCRGSIDPVTSFRRIPGSEGQSSGAEPNGCCVLFALRFEGAVRDMIHALKYEGRTSLAHDLGTVAGRCLAHRIRTGVEAVVPIPLHRVRLRQRGFNQSALLASRLANLMEAPLVTGSLVRTRATLSQTGLSREDRVANVDGAFEVRGRALHGRHVLVFDDVVTSGATMGEARRVLLGSGVAAVTCAAAAGPPCRGDRVVSHTSGRGALTLPSKSPPDGESG
jgi:ComF family protein